MNVVKWYVGFHNPIPLRKLIGQPAWSFLGHVEIWGYTRDATWFFLDPGAKGSTLVITHHADEIDELFARRIMHCSQILKLDPITSQIRLPLHPTMNCVSVCAHMLGIRAYTPGRFRRILLAHGAEVWNHETTDPERGSSDSDDA